MEFSDFIAITKICTVFPGKISSMIHLAVCNKALLINRYFFPPGRITYEKL